MLTEDIARKTIFGPDGNSGLTLEIYDLLQPHNDDRLAAWQIAENRLLEMLHVVRTVQSAIQGRVLRPAKTA
jgi:hypothetical protein